MPCHAMTHAAHVASYHAMPSHAKPCRAHLLCARHWTPSTAVLRSASGAPPGDKPELLYPVAAAELAAMGYGSTLEYVAAAAAAVMRETGLLPHINAGGRPLVGCVADMWPLVGM